MKSAQANQSFPTSGSNDLLLSGVLLPGPHRCADEVFINLPSDVRLPRSVDPQNSLPSPPLGLRHSPAPPSPDLRFTFPKRIRAWCVIWWRWRRPEGAVITTSRIKETAGANSGDTSRPACPFLFLYLVFINQWAKL